ncbi:DUF7660 family protein [Saccharibacillus alkalitolerans]|uniref:DUF7660 domain-containing protein n=1 Tax=Saccharibacillus alkalitolerans TaxID=2705290 RepID=A0ABX0F6V7_9BACL|nr:hypothetical protein [Saccharibacillus alkalitolerans]NGZ75269.1 hypothetical protein [Saccharibacillus alkalitolerans]
MNIYEELEKVTGREGFVSFVHRLAGDLENNSDKWANVTLKDYLLSIASWVEDGAPEREEKERRVPEAAFSSGRDVEWERLAFLLFAASRYE